MLRSVATFSINQIWSSVFRPENSAYILAGWNSDVSRPTTSKHGFFNNATTSVLVAYDNPTITIPVTFRPSATDANNHLRTNLAASYVQNQIELSKYVQVVAGLRFDYFDLQFHNNRTGEDLRRIDRLLSPRAGVVFKPVTPLSIYANYSVAYLPSSGDHSLPDRNPQQVNQKSSITMELGIKWDVYQYLSLTARFTGRID